MGTILGTITDLLTKRRQAAIDSYRELVAAEAAGKELKIDPERALGIIRDAGRSLEGFQADVELHCQRILWVQQLAESERAERDRTAAERTLNELLERRQQLVAKATAKIDAEIVQARKRHDAVRSKVYDTQLPRRKLIETAAQALPELAAELGDLDAARRTASQAMDARRKYMIDKQEGLQRVILEKQHHASKELDALAKRLEAEVNSARRDFEEAEREWRARDARCVEFQSRLLKP